MALFATDGGAMRDKGSGLASSALAAAYADARKQGSMFVLTELVNKKMLDSPRSGSSVSELKQTAEAAKDRVLFGAADGSLLQSCIAGKWYALQIVGDDVGGMVRGAASLHKNAAFNCMDGTVGEVCGTTEEFVQRLASA